MNEAVALRGRRRAGWAVSRISELAENKNKSSERASGRKSFGKSRNEEEYSFRIEGERGTSESRIRREKEEAREECARSRGLGIASFPRSCDFAEKRMESVSQTVRKRLTPRIKWYRNETIVEQMPGHKTSKQLDAPCSPPYRSHPRRESKPTSLSLNGPRQTALCAALPAWIAVLFNFFPSEKIVNKQEKTFVSFADRSKKKNRRHSRARSQPFSRPHNMSGGFTRPRGGALNI